MSSVAELYHAAALRAQPDESGGDVGRDQGAVLDGDEDFGDEQPLLEPFTQLSLDRPLTSTFPPGLLVLGPGPPVL